jgi:hypothetical protein
MPWSALSADVEPSVQVSLLRHDHGPPFLATMAGDVRPAKMMEVIASSSDQELREHAAKGWISKAPNEPKVFSRTLTSLMTSLVFLACNICPVGV